MVVRRERAAGASGVSRGSRPESGPRPLARARESRRSGGARRRGATAREQATPAALPRRLRRTLAAPAAVGLKRQTRQLPARVRDRAQAAPGFRTRVPEGRREFPPHAFDVERPRVDSLEAADAVQLQLQGALLFEGAQPAVQLSAAVRVFVDRESPPRLPEGNLRLRRPVGEECGRPAFRGRCDGFSRALGAGGRRGRRVPRPRRSPPRGTGWRCDRRTTRDRSR